MATERWAIARGAMTMSDFRIAGKRALVVGAGKSGCAAAALLSREGASVLVTDWRPEGALSVPDSIKAESNIAWRLGEHRASDFVKADLVVVSPGVSLGIPALQEPVSRRTPIIGELELGFRYFTAPIYAVTGSNGKSTTTALAGEMLRASGRNVFVGGNLGTPLCEAVLSGEPWEAGMIEVSSFQLETIQTFKPNVAGLLNISPNHLDRYGTMENYISAKRRLFENQTEDDFAVLNGDLSVVLDVLPRLRSKAILFGNRRPFDDGIWSDGVKIWTAVGGTIRPLFDLSDIRLRGGHNVENVMAAAAIALLAGAHDAACRDAVRQFEGLPHRLERVREWRGAVFYNDSKATTVESVIRSIESFTDPIVLIAGGRAKGGDFGRLVRAVGRRICAAILIGEAKGVIGDAFKGIAPVFDFDTIETAVKKAAEIARPGDVVLLAPGCASFDMFANFEARGDAFKEAVHGL